MSLLLTFEVNYLATRNVNQQDYQILGASHGNVLPWNTLECYKSSCLLQGLGSEGLVKGIKKLKMGFLRKIDSNLTTNSITEETELKLNDVDGLIQFYQPNSREKPNFMCFYSTL